MSRSGDTEAIVAGLKAAMPALADRLTPGGYVERGEYWPCNPARADRSPGSFVVQIYGDKAGMFHDYAAPEFSGDVIDFIALFEFGMTPPDGRKDKTVWDWARQYLAMPAADRAAPKAWAQKPADFVDPRPDEAKEQGAMKWWLDARPIAPGSVGWRYLSEARRIPLERLARHPGAIREVGAMTYNMADAKGTKWPGLLTCMTDGKGQIRAVHRTFLKPDGSGKAPVAKQKQMWPRVKGLSIRLSRGKSGLTPEEAARRGLCDDRQVLIEGIEKGLAYAVLFPDDRVTAPGSFSLFKSAPLFDCAREILIVADNDETFESGAVDQMARDIQRRAGGRKVLITRPMTAKDVDELL